MKKLLAIIGITDRKSLMSFLRQMAGFLVVGAINMAAYYGVYHLALNLGLHYMAANVVGFVVSFFVSFVLNKLFVFHPRHEDVAPVSENINKSVAGTGQFVRMLITNLGYLALSSGLLALFVRVLGVGEDFAPIWSMFILIPYSFLMTKLWVFKE